MSKRVYKRSWKKRLATNKVGALEGLPLQLLIVVIIAVVAIGIIMAWLGNIGEPPKSVKSIAVDIAGVDYIDLSKYTTKNPTINITVYDQSNNKLDGALVTLDSCGYNQKTIATGSGTNKKGTATFKDKVELPPGINTGEITVTVKKSGYTSKSTTIQVYISG